jgi:diacylglycerol kinase family enzyme
MPSTLVIYNPIAGHGRVQAHWLLVKKALHQADVEFDAVATRAPLDAMLLAEQAPQKYSAVVGIGGTMHEIVNGLMRASGEGETIAMGVVPLGNGNDFAKVIPPDTPIGGKLFDWRAAVQKIARMQTQLFDAGRILGDQIICVLK